MTQITILDVVNLNIKVLVQVTKCQQLDPIGVTHVPSTVKNQVDFKKAFFSKDFNTKNFMRVSKPETKFENIYQNHLKFMHGYRLSI